MSSYAEQVANVGTQGQDARYDTTNTWYDPQSGMYTDGYYHYPEQGKDVLSNDRPNSYVSGLPGANEHNESGGYGGGGGGIVGGGGDLLADPFVAQYRAQMQAAAAADRADTQASLRQLLVQFGLVPQGFTDSMGALDDTTKALIQKNTDTGISGYARLLEGKGDAQRNTISQLAGAGLSRSGAKGFKLRRGQLDFDRNLNDAISKVTTEANAGQSGYAQRERERQSALSAFLAQMAANFRARTAPAGGGGGSKYVPQAPAIPPMEQAIQYWQSDPAPTYTSPTSGQEWYGGVKGIESTPFKGKAEDSLYAFH